MSSFHLWINKISKFSKFLLIFLVIAAWIFSGWPQIWQNPPAPLNKYLSGPFPPAINIVQAATTTIFITSTASTTWTVPTDWNNAANTIEVIGGGGGGGGGAGGSGNGSGSGGGGGAYAKISNLTLTPGGSVTIQVGAGGTGGAAGANGITGTATWFNGASCLGASACGAAGSNGLTSSATGGAGGTVANSTGTIKFAGGSGGAGSATVGTSGGGGGGAAGLNGVGSGAANGPSPGGQGDAGFGGAGGAAGNPAANGGNGTEYDATHGSGGGGGGGNVKATTATGGVGGLYGAGGGGGAGKAAGGNGNQGLIVISYTPAAATVSCAASTSTTSFGTINTAAVYTSSPNASTSMTCNGALGCTLYVNDAGSGAQPGLYKSVSPTYLVKSPNSAFNATATLAANTDGYGIQATTTTAGTGGILTITPQYLQNGNTVGGLATTTIILASSSAAVTNREVLITHEAAVGPNALGGNYTDTITYSCASN